MRTAIATACVAVAVGVGVALAGCGPKSPTAAPPSTSDSPGASASASASPSPSAPPSQDPGPPASTPIPDSAFFQPPATRTRDKPARADSGAGLVPAFCKSASPLMKPVRVRHRTVVFYGLKASPESIPDGTVEQTIATYNGGDAAEVLNRFRAAVAACPTDKLADTGATVTYKVLPAYAVGDEAVLIERTWTNPPDFPGKTISLYVVVRIGSAVTLLTVDGWEGLDADADVSREYAGLAAAAIQKWRS